MNPLTHTEPVMENTEPTLQDVLHAIAASRSVLEVKIDTLSIDLGFLQDDHKLRVVTPTGTELLSTPEDTWSWLETHTTSDPTNDSQQDKKQRRHRSRRRQATPKRTPPNPDEVQTERQRVVEAVAMLGEGPRRSNMASPLSSQKEDDHLDSDNETATSTQSSGILPMITPGTADDII
ncbi:hypothetical protein NDU88_006102 [Pleurodeles waltl]|uniref:Uncharacterized protein n=1 Tax=Pleurodeles waltl TaxID=8319 RepID=A0AAV7SNJ5_PLEWA|nr:hypothetical protein NDU88_006102 [Pleurodeles waltl]